MKIIEHETKPKQEIAKPKQTEASKKYDFIYALESDGLRIAELNGKELWLEAKQ